MSNYDDFNSCCNGWGVAFKSKDALAHAIWDFTNNTTETENKYGKMNCWDVRAITDMSHLFTGAFINEPIDCWDVTSVTNMHGMFQHAASFNQPLDSWDVSKVAEMGFMFDGATSFDQPLVSWNVGSVTDMSYMFSDALSFNQPLDGWNVGRVTTMQAMFNGANSFNQVLCTWYKIGCPNAPDFTDIFESNSCPSTAVPDCNTMTSFCGTCTKDLPTLSLSKSSPTNQSSIKGFIFGVASAVFVMAITLVYFKKRRKTAPRIEKSLEKLAYPETEMSSKKSQESPNDDIRNPEASENQNNTVVIEFDLNRDDVSGISAMFHDEPTSNDFKSDYNLVDDPTVEGSIIEKTEGYKTLIAGTVNPTVNSTCVEDEEIHINLNAPSGKLGLVIGANINGQIIIKGIKSGSSMSGIIQVGDFLKAVDGESTEGKTSEQVTQLVSSRANNPVRALELVRNTELVV